MRILILGGSRFIGREITRLSLQADHEVIHFNRGMTADLPGTPRILGNVDELLSHRDGLRALNPDVVVHCIAYTEKHGSDLVRALEGTEAHLIALSSMDCYEVFQGVNRGQELSDFPVSEDMPTTPIRYYWRGTSHSNAELYDKNLMTDELLRAHEAEKIVATVLRLPMVYGPDDYQFQHRHGETIRRISDQRRIYPMAQLDQTQLGTFGYIENVAAAVVHCYGRSEVSGQIYNVGETHVRTRRRWADLYAKTAGFEFEFEILPDELLAQDSKYRNWPAQHVVFDCSRFQRETGFTDPVPLEHAIQRTLSWGLTHVDALGPRPDYGREERLIAAYRSAMDRLRNAKPWS